MFDISGFGIIALIVGGLGFGALAVIGIGALKKLWTKSKEKTPGG